MHGVYGRKTINNDDFFSQFDSTNDENLVLINEMMDYEILTEDDTIIKIEL